MDPDESQSLETRRVGDDIKSINLAISESVKKLCQFNDWKGGENDIRS